MAAHDALVANVGQGEVQVRIVVVVVIVEVIASEGSQLLPPDDRLQKAASGEILQGFHHFYRVRRQFAAALPPTRS